MTDRSRAARDQIRRVSAALREHWDPIGGGQMPDLPADEYENYAPHIITLIREGADDFKLVAHLRELERVAMGLRPSPADDLLSVVRHVRRALE
jgi:hypothetical protein